MGLDVTVYEGVRKADSSIAAQIMGSDAPHELAESRGMIIPLIDPNFRRQAAGIEEVPYTWSSRREFRAGSYSWYDWYREQLAALVGIGGLDDLDAFWLECAEQRLVGPFSEQIAFSGCEGTIGPSVSAKLAADYDEWLDRAEQRAAQLENGANFIEAYRDWQRAFRDAAAGGFLQFC